MMLTQNEMVKRSLNRPQSNFPELLVQHGEYAVARVEALLDYLKKPGTKRSVQARKTEKHTDEIQRILIHELENTFVTPIDREDFFAPSRAIDNFVDNVYDTVAGLEIFELTPSEAMKSIANLLLEMANELHLVVQRLFDHPRVANDRARRIKGIENRVETA